MREDLATLDALRVAGRDGRVVMRFGFQMVLSLDEGWRPEVRRAVLSIAQDYRREAPEAAAFLRSGAARYAPVRDDNFDSYYEARIQRDPEARQPFHLVLIDPSDGQPEPAAHKVEALLVDGAAATREDRVAGVRRSRLTVEWPVEALLADPAGMVARLVDWCGRLPVEQGTAGLAPLVARGAVEACSAECLPFLRRFPGLDFPLPEAAGPIWGGLRAVNWLTVLGAPYIAALGGYEALAQGLPEGVVQHDIEGGVLLQAGPMPELGDTEAGRWPEACRDLAAFLRPLRLDPPQEAGALFGLADPDEAREEMRAWMGRFDR